MSIRELYVKGCKVWIPDSEKVWKCGHLSKNYEKDEIIIELDDSESKTIQIKSKDDLPHLCNPQILIGENDLTSLSYLHEPAVLHNLQVQFCNHNAIYTYCGIVLVAINPYHELPIYGSDTIGAYRGQAMGDLDPHIFAVAEEAFMKMEREGRDQSIIVSGESGAGKTVSAKYAMRYFATVGGSADETKIEKKILASSPIMEAIGNAKTTRNDNSSRFGKYIELDFSKNFHIRGANMRTYLLEKSRVVFQAPEERNYHIFYQLCSVSAQDKFSHLKLDIPDNFHYLNQGGNSSIDGVDDAKDFSDTCEAFSLLGIEEGKQSNIFRILASLLHTGNVEIFEGNSDSCSIDSSDEHLVVAAELLGVNLEDLRMWLCNRKIISGREVFTKPMTVFEAIFYRDALVKHIYAKLFDWIVNQINKCFASSFIAFRFIGVLDIYGFETFDTNSFEQFCINYANEKLQQQFNQHVFKLEQEEYVKENIQWEFIHFYDNQPCIDLIESKLGILDLLDEECRMPKGSDQSWVDKLYDKCKKWDHFSKPRLSNTSFLISHFADKVDYESSGFLEKNRDTISEECINVLQSSRYSLVKELFLEKSDLLAPKKKKISPTTVTSKSKQMKKSVGSQFRDSLNLLMGTLNSTTPHYVRCIKPNDEKRQFSFDPVRAIQQLRACGVLETVRISAAGYPSRWTYSDFFTRYRVLCKSQDIKRENMKETCERIVWNMIKDEDKFKIGKTKIFFRAGQVAYMEKLRANRLRACGIMIQKHVKGFLHKKRYQKIRRSTLIIQRYVRGYIARRKVFHIKRLKAAVIIQSTIRGWVKRVQYQKLRYTVVQIQAHARGKWARERYVHMRQVRAAVVIQKNVRMYLAVQKYIRVRRGLIAAQGLVRCFLARRVLKKLKVEAKSVEHQKKLNKGLENKIISLQQKVTSLQKANASIPSFKEEISTLKAQLGNLKNMELTLKASNNRIALLTAQVEQLSSKLETEKCEKIDILNEKDQQNKENIEIIEKLNAQNIRISSLLSEAKKDGEKLEEEEKWREKIIREKDLMMQEFDEEKQAYQRLLIDYADLEQKSKNLERELGQVHGNKTHQRTASSLSNISDATTEPAYDDTNDSQCISIEDDAGYNSVQRPLKNRRYENDMESKTSALSEKLQELEMENVKLKDDLFKLRKVIAENDPDKEAKELMNQFRNLEDELDRRKEECMQMRTVLASQTNEIGSISQSLNEDGEIASALQAQKAVNRQLLEELNYQKAKYDQHKGQSKLELQKVREDNDRQQNLINQFLTNNAGPNGPEALLQSEVIRLTDENLSLQNQIDSLHDQVKKYKRTLKTSSSKQKDGSGNIEEAPKVDPSAPAIRKKEREYMGMFEFDRKEEIQIIRIIIYELKPRFSLTLLPGLPAYILFMCIRYLDHVNDDDRVQSLLNNIVNGLKRVIKKRTEDLESTVLWLSNTLRLLHTLKQYSGEKAYQAENTPKQNEQSLKNFDLSEYRHVLSDIGVWIYNGVIKIMEKKVQPLIIPAVLEHEAITGLSGNKPGGMRGRTTSTSTNSPTNSQKSIDDLLNELTQFYRVLATFGTDPDIITQVFRQIFYFICAGALNNLLLRKDMCHWSKGMQIRFNVSHLEQWTRDMRLNESGVTETLLPIIQAAQLLQARKTNDDVSSICDMCDKLSVSQIVKILNLYTPADEYEERVPISFITKIQAKLQDRAEGEQQQAILLMNTKFAFPVRFSFNPSTIRLEDIEIPEGLNATFLKKM